ncbi:MAG: hypothetical protein ACXWTR_03950 [Methylotenera sp.]
MKLQNNSAQHPEQINTQEEPASLGVPATSTALSTLFEAAADNLTKDQLEYLAKMSERAELEAESLSSSLMTLGSLIRTVDQFNEPGYESIGEIFWNLSHQLDHIRGLISVADSARFELGQRKAKVGK